MKAGNNSFPDKYKEISLRKNPSSYSRGRERGKAVWTQVCKNSVRGVLPCEVGAESAAKSGQRGEEMERRRSERP